MSTQPTEKEKQSSGAIADSPAQPTFVQQGQAPPLPPQRPVRSKYRGWYIGFAISIVLLLLLSIGVFAFSQFGPGQQGRQPTPTAPPSTVQPTSPPTTPTPAEQAPTPVAGVVLGPQPCPAGIGDPAHWNAIIGTNNGERSVVYISCANIMGNPSLQALVLVRHSNANRTLDVYVFDHITSANPSRIFLLQGLLKGDAKISGYNTVMTAEVDKNSSLNAGKSVSAMTVDLFREFDWSAQEGTLVQTAFPGLFPDLTRYQAELDQRTVSKGQDTWKNDPAKVAQQLAVKLLEWSPDAQATVVSGGSSQDVDASVQLHSSSPDHPVITVTLSRLEGNPQNMWVAIAVSDGTTMSISSPVKWDLLSSPATVKGTGSAFEGDVGTVYVLDHLYNDIGHAKGVPASNGKTTFTATVPYNATFHGGAQEGLLAYYSYSQADGAIAGAAIQKVLLSA